MFLLNGHPLAIDSPFEHDGYLYPSNWLRLSSLEEKEALGITEVPDTVRADDRFYWNGDINIPKELEDKEESKGLKSNYISQIKQTANSLLSQTDWYITRKIERNIEIPEDVVSKRLSIISEANRLEDVIKTVTCVEELIEVLNTQNWNI